MLKLPFLLHTVSPEEATDTLVRLQHRLPHMLAGNIEADARRP